jgi:ketosteroid isomerase-like protein
METNQERSAIEKLIFSYSDAFNAADISKIVASFTTDGINMPNNGPLAQGAEQLTKAFGFLLSMAQIHIEYVIDEIVVAGEYAYVRTNSIVKTVVKANGDQILLENKELFVLRNDNGEWKISHYIFNNTKTTK